ncbi:zinc-binding dehydrogenase, partial [Desertihabitans aurantiacus]|uniref:zinc-binding dehydrogenase n=1 Tax=Desertihabitans aurantiacus TaxID=2282477 RepID=UPI0013005A78
RVVGVDISPAARQRAAELGATVLAPGEGEALLDLTDGGADVAVDAVGSAATLEASVRSLRRRGRHVQIGLLLGERAAPPVPMDLVVAHELSLHGSHGMAAAGYPGLLALVADGSLRPAELVGRVVGLDGAAGALAAMSGPTTAAGTTVIRLDRAGR